MNRVTFSDYNEELKNFLLTISLDDQHSCPNQYLSGKKINIKILCLKKTNNDYCAVIASSYYFDFSYRDHTAEYKSCHLFPSFAASLQL
jgi:hypothetical protein